jgi:hypothetical protein
MNIATPADAQSSNAAGAMSSIATLYPDKVFALHNVVELDGRIGHWPVSVRGYAPCNCYLLKEDDGALLLDTGFAAHKDAIIAQIESLVGRNTPLSLIALRINDYLSVCNAVPIARHFPIEQLYGMTQNTPASLDFHSRTREEAAEVAARLPLNLIAGNEWVEVGHGGKRPVKFHQSPVRLINTRWVYDPLSKTLFTSDMFAHTWSSTPDKEWFIDEANDDTTEEDVRRFMLSTRYWWLESARTDELRERLAKVFEEFDIQNIAPGYGKILRGARVVQRHYRLLDEVLRRLDRRNTPPRYVAHNEEHYR